MNNSEEIKIRPIKVERYVWTLAVVWIMVIAGSLVWNMVQIKQDTLEAARIQARTAHKKDVIYRNWNAGHGGVYVPVTEETQPNIYLSDVPERDIATPSGKLLTLINPAYMTRQVHELGEEEYGVQGHITSLNPIRLENSPDSWETEALKAFERGENEISSVEEMESEDYMRLMRPLITEKNCLKCHAVQGYQEGDIRGGISVSIPMEPMRAASRIYTLRLAFGHVLILLIGMGGIALGIFRFRRSERERCKAEEALQKGKDELEIRVEERTVELRMTNEQLEQEITERKQVEEKTKQLEKYLRLQINRMPIGLIVWDTKFHVKSWNPAAEKIFGFTVKEAMGKHPNDLIVPKEAQPHVDEIWRRLIEGDMTAYSTNENITKDDRTIICDWSNTPLKEDYGTVTGVLSMVQDITERKQMEQMLIQSEKMASIGILAAGIAHEINNPTGYILSNLETLKEYNEDINSFFSDLQTFIEECSKTKSEIIEDLIDKLKKSKEDKEIDYLLKDTDNAIMESLSGAERIKKIVSDLKDFSRKEKPEMKLAKINDGIEKTLNVVWIELKYKAEVIKEFGDIPEIECDINRLDQVFMNILVNAAQAIDKRGKITIKTFTENNFVVIQISDTGKGIPKENIGKVFDAFYTSKEVGKGTGLGLSISHKIIQEHNGTIDVESEVGKGAVFTIKLPVK